MPPTYSPYAHQTEWLSRRDRLMAHVDDYGPSYTFDWTLRAYTNWREWTCAAQTRLDYRVHRAPLTDREIARSVMEQNNMYRLSMGYTEAHRRGLV